MFKKFKINKVKIEKIKEDLIITGVNIVYWILMTAIALVLYPFTPIFLLIAWTIAPTSD